MMVFTNPQNELIPHLFRAEFSKISAVLARLFGMAHIEVAEDIASETFLSALETWPYKGVPENPRAWLYTVAKNKTKNYLKRNELLAKKILPQLTQELAEAFDVNLSEDHIADSTLAMLFALCHPGIPPESQIALSLRILCGFGIDEIATAFLSNKETINKRLSRAKEKLREAHIEISIPPLSEIEGRLDSVLTTLYLLFSEGYYSENNEELIREDFCAEAMRLAFLLIENPVTRHPQVHALYALMCFHASRFEARKGASGEIILYDDQDPAAWNTELVARGAFHLNQSTGGPRLSKFHLEASIAYWYTVSEDSPEKWESILQLYNRLLQIAYSPIAALNRTYALSKANGKDEAIRAAEKLRLTNNHFYFALLGELYTGIDDCKAKAYFKQAIELAQTQSGKQVIVKKLERL